MGTSNYYNKNASSIYAIDEVEDEFVYEDIVENITYSLKELAKVKNRDCSKTSKEVTELKNYPSTAIVDYETSFNYCNEDITIRLTTMTTSGYYYGMNLDYEVSIFCDSFSDKYDNAESLIYDIKEYSDNKTLLKLHLSNLENKIEKILKELIDEVESVFKENTEKLEVEAVSSSGETIYKKAS